MINHAEFVNALPDVLPLDIKDMIWKITIKDWLETEAPEGLRLDMLKRGRTVFQVQYPQPPQPIVPPK